MKIKKTISLTVLLVLLSGCGTSNYYHQKYGPAGMERPSQDRTELELENQIEGHTCGFHAMSTIYKSYGLDPVDKKLRFRLGVDKPAIPFDSSTLGSIHPDIFRVAAQDGFHTGIVDLETDGSSDVCSILSNQHPIMTLIQRKENGNLHWVVLNSCNDDGKVLVYDSLFSAPYEESLSEYMKMNVLSMIAFVPSYPKPESVVWKMHRRGIIEMKKVAGRIRKD